MNVLANAAQGLIKMARNPKKKSLYEVIGKSRPTMPAGEQQARQEEKPGRDRQGGSPGGGNWPRKPRIAQINDGRVELSMPYQLVIAVILAVLLIGVVFFRLGQLSASGNSAAKTGEGQAGVIEPSEEVASAGDETRAEIELGPDDSQSTTTEEGNRIVIQTYRQRTDLIPVKQYFAEHGIETEIKQIGQWYYLVTAEQYETVDKPGSEGYAVKQRIVDLGAEYKAPPGYETFGRRPFHDAFGKKFDN